MSRKMSLSAGSLLLCLLFSSPSQALFGVGAHWGFDFTLKMEDSDNEYLSFAGFMPNSMFANSQILVDAINTQLGISADSLLQLINPSPIITDMQVPFYITRAGWERHPINFGAKIFIDGIPKIDAVEISMNLGVWQYDGQMHYPTGLNPDLTINDLSDPASITYEDLLSYESRPLTLDEFGLSFFGLSKTPYMKLHFDVSIRKNLIAVPKKLKILKVYLGGGPSLHLATPTLTPSLVEEVIGDALEAAGSDMSQLSGVMNDTELMKKIVQKLIDGLSVPKFGMHIVAGTMVKIPVIPLGFYADCKYMIPFGDLDKDAKLKGYGFLFNTGISMSLGK